MSRNGINHSRLDARGLDQILEVVFTLTVSIFLFFFSEFPSLTVLDSRISCDLTISNLAEDKTLDDQNPLIRQVKLLNGFHDLLVEVQNICIWEYILCETHFLHENEVRRYFSRIGLELCHQSLSMALCR